MKLAAALIGLSLLALASGSAHGSDEIRIGQTLPYSGPASGFGAIGRTQEAFFEKINADGGINGRKVKFITLDDAYSPPKTVEQTRKLVEQDEVLMMFGSLGTATNSAVQRYLNGKKVPQLFVLSGATKWVDPQKYPWTMPGMAAYESEGVVYAKHVLRTKPGAKIAILSQNDDFGRDYVAGFKRALGDKAASMIIAEQTYETSAPTISSQLSTLKSSGADVLFGVVLGKFTSQMIKGVAEIGWKPELFFVPTSASSISFLERGGARQRRRPDLVEQSEGHDGPAMGQRSRREGILRLHEAIHAERRPLQLQLRGRLPLRDAADDRAEGVQG
ncbi:ABC-type branched-subunit amino acid transport system substrate-binding protein [Bradyrhizobium liaoningense]